MVYLRIAWTRNFPKTLITVTNPANNNIELQRHYLFELHAALPQQQRRLQDCQD